MLAHIISMVLIAFGLVTFDLPAELTDDQEWELYYIEAYAEYADEFTQLFNALEYKRSKNGRSMIRRPGDSSFKFVAKA